MNTFTPNYSAKTWALPGMGSVRWGLALLLLCVAPLCAEPVDFVELAAENGWDDAVGHTWGPAGPGWDFSGEEGSYVPMSGVKFSKEYTFETWVKFSPEGTEGINTLLSSDKNRRYQLVIVSGEVISLRYRNSDKGTSYYECPYSFEPGRWYQIVLSIGPSSGVAFYVNGELQARQFPTVPGMSSFPVASIGAYCVDRDARMYDQFFKGAMSGVKLYPRILSEDEVRTAYREAAYVPEIVPMPQTFEYTAGEGLAIAGSLAVKLEDSMMEADDPALAALNEQWKALTGSALSFSGMASDGARLVIKQGDVEAAPEGDVAKEAYVLTIDSEGIEIMAPTKRGAAYALYSLISLLKPGAKSLPALSIHDWPEFPFRGFLYLGHSEPPEMLKASFQKDMKELIPTLAQYRVNHITVRIADWIWLDDPEVEEAARNLFAYAAKHHVEMVPMNRSYSHSKHFLARDLRTGHTDMIEDEELTLKGDEPVALSVKNVIITQHTPIIVKSRQGDIYEEGVDYSVVDGEIKTEWKHPPGTRSSWSRPHLPEDNEPWRIRRIPGGSISDGETVLVTYDVARVMRGMGHGSYSPFSEFTRDIQRNSIEKMSDITKGGTLNARYLNFGMDEIWVLRTEGRSSSHNNLTDEETLVYEINKLDEDSYNENASNRIMIWSDMFDPRQTPTWKKSLDYMQVLGPELSRDVIMMPWYYPVSSDSLTRAAESIEFLTSKGFPVVGTSGHDPLNNLYWGEILFNAKYQTGAEVHGLLYTTWAYGPGDRMAGLPAFAQATWSPGQVMVSPIFELIECLRRAGIATGLEATDPAPVLEAIARQPGMQTIMNKLRMALLMVDDEKSTAGEEKLNVLNAVGLDVDEYYELGLEVLDSSGG